MKRELPARVDDLIVVDHRHAGRALSFVGLFGASATATVLLARHLSGVQLLALAPLYLVSAASLHGISLFTHEGVHGSLAKSRFWNHLLSAVAA